MAYDPKSLARITQVAVAAGDMCNKFLYGTNDAPAVVETASYFTDKKIRKGDIIECAMSRGGTPVTKTYVATAVTVGGVATIALQSTT